MKPFKRAYVALIAAVAGVPFFAGPVWGQVRQDTSGRALDANPQLGSGGYNQPSPTQRTWSDYQNAIATDNVTGGFGFQGTRVNGVNLGAGYADPFAFRGLLAGQGVDQFIAASTGVPTMANPTASSSSMATGSNPSQQFYGSANHSPIPGYQPIPNGQGYVPQQPVSQSPGDARLGAIDFSGSSQVIPKPYEMILPGPVDTSGNPPTQSQQMLAINPLFGVVNWTMMPATEQGQQNGSPGLLNQSPLQRGLTPLVSQGLTPGRLKEIRDELSGQSSNTGAAGTQNNTGDVGSRPLPALRPGVDESSDPSRPLSSLNSQSNRLNATNLAPVAGDVSTNQSSRNYPVDVNLPPPGQQSAVYAKLRQAIADYDSKHSMTDEQANQKFQEILRIRNQANVNAEGGGNVLSGPGAGANPSGIPSPEEPNVGQPNLGPMAPAANLSTGRTGNNDLLKQQGFGSVPKNMGAGPGMGLPPVSAPPVPINSFASGIKSKGLADLIASGEVAVQQGQYDKAIAAYNQAVDVVPNNPLILMARATAELGGQYYAQADADIHLAIAEDPAVLVGQYDLEKHLGQARLKSTLGDLKSISQNAPDDTIHAFLLTYAYYNSHHVGQAAEWLQITDGRMHGQDPAIMQMKKYWNFNEELPAVPAPNPKTAGPTTRSAH